MSLTIKKYFRWLLPVIMLSIGVGGFIYLKQSAPEPQPVSATERAWQIETLEVRPKLHVPVLQLHGVVETADLFTAVAPGAARVERVAVRDGQRVTKGQLLVALDEADFQPRVMQERADVNELEAQISSEHLRHENDQAALARERQLLQTASRALERAESLQSRDLGSQAQIDEARDAVERATLTVASREQSIADHPARLAALESRLQRARADLQIAERDLARSTIRAPYDGIVAHVEVATADQVNAFARLLEMYPADGLRLRARLPSRHAAEILEAMDNEVRLGGTTLENDLPLTLTGLAGQGDGRGVELLFDVDAGNHALRLGSMVTIRLERPPAADSIALPYSALYGSDRVYRVRDGRLERVRVTQIGEVPRAGETWMLVRSPDLVAGDRVAVTHLPNAVNGLKVQTADEQTAP
ncbi:MAG: efflux RND transporter periplasmic adaptor subunit [Halothiobacillaceae bacterium]